MSSKKESTVENGQTVETSDATSAEILELKKELVEEFVKKNFDSLSPFKKGIIKNYLIDKKTPIDNFFDNYIIGGLGKMFGLLPPDIKAYREMFNEADTKNKLEELRKTILNGIGGTEQVSETDYKPENLAENSEGIVGKACQIAINIADDNNYGYEHGGTGNNNGRKGFDCQGFVRYCYIESGINVPPSGGCDDMKGDFEKAGFECITFNTNEKLKPGDILLDPKKHTEMCVGEDKIAGAHSNKDKKAGDGGGEEISIRSLKSSLSYRNPKYILRYKGDLA